MNNLEVHHALGFVKQAATYNIPEQAALEIYKTGSVSSDVLKALVGKLPGMAALGNAASGAMSHARTVAPQVGSELLSGAQKLMGVGTNAVQHAAQMSRGMASADRPLTGRAAANILDRTYRRFKPQAGAALGNTAGNLFNAVSEGLDPRLKQHLGLEYFGGLHDKINPMVSSKADSVAQALRNVLQGSEGDAIAEKLHNIAQFIPKASR